VRLRTRFILLVFLLPWGTEQALAASWLPGKGTRVPARQEVFPLALRDRQQLLRQVGSPPSRALDLILLPLGSSQHGAHRPRRPGHRPRGADLRYLLMSLQC
jgi:hypothetical protein